MNKQWLCTLHLCPKDQLGKPQKKRIIACGVAYQINALDDLPEIAAKFEEQLAISHIEIIRSVSLGTQ